MFRIQRIKIRGHEVGLQFVEGEFRGLLGEGTHWVFNPLRRIAVEVVSQRTPQFVHPLLDLVVKSGELKGRARVVDLKDGQRGLVWVDGRFVTLLPPGQFVFWTGCREVRVEVVDVRRDRFEHDDLRVIVRASAGALLEVHTVGRGGVGVLFLDGQFVEVLEPGLYAFWRGVADVRMVEVDLREATLDVSGQEIMTADKVSLRLNAVVTYRVADPRRAVCTTEDAKQGLYREAQRALRAVIGARELDVLLADKDVVAREVEAMLGKRAEELGLAVLSTGLRDLILPGDMKDLMNKVIEARKAAEANLVTRREETAALRSQANTARLLAENPVLMRMKELEVLEKVAGGGKLSIVLGESGLADRVVNLL